MKKVKLALIDHNDSFTFNIIDVFRNFSNVKLTLVKYDDLIVADLESYDKIILSPGPCLPKDYPKTLAVIKSFYKSKPILGICLGHQAICSFFGAELYNFKDVIHGVDKKIQIYDFNSLFYDVPNDTKVGLYHSWAVDITSLPAALKALAVSDDEVLMSVKHKDYAIYGIQFHPESFLTIQGKLMLKNFIELC